MEADTLLQEANKLGQEASKQTGVPFTPQPITPAVIEPNVAPVVLPKIPTSTTAEGITGIAQSTVEQNKLQQELEKQAEEARATAEQEKSSYKSLVDNVLGVVGSRSQLEQDAKISEKAQRLTDVTNKLEASQRAQTNELRALEGSGLTDSQKVARSREINRQYAFEQADLALIQSAANRDLDTATSIIDRKIQLQLEPLKLQLDFTKEFYQEARDSLSDKEKKAFDNKIKTLDRKYEEEQTKVETLEKTRLELLFSASTQGASQDILSAIQRAKTPQEAIIAAGQYGGDILDRQLKNAQLNEIKLKNDEKQAYIDAIASGKELPLTKEQKDFALKLSSDYEAASKDYITQVNAYNRIKASAVDPSPAGDVALIFNYMKLLDPGSVVREGEFATAQNSASIPERIRNQYNNALKGTRLGDAQRDDFVDRAEKLYTSSTQQHEETVVKPFTERSNRFGVPFDLVVRPVSSTVPITQNQTVDPTRGVIEGLSISFPGGVIIDFPSIEALNNYKKAYGITQ